MVVVVGVGGSAEVGEGGATVVDGVGVDVGEPAEVVGACSVVVGSVGDATTVVLEADDARAAGRWRRPGEPELGQLVHAATARLAATASITARWRRGAARRGEGRGNLGMVMVSGVEPSDANNGRRSSVGIRGLFQPSSLQINNFPPTFSESFRGRFRESITTSAGWDDVADGMTTKTRAFGVEAGRRGVPSLTFARADARRPRIALVTEGTYPCAGGGVSVWCDQLMRNLPSIDFEVTALMPTDRDPGVWRPPSNLIEVRRIGVWDRVADRLRRPSSSAVPQAVRSFIWFLLGEPIPDLRTELDLFAVHLDGLLELAAADALGPSLQFESIHSTVAEALAVSEYVNSRCDVTLADGIDLANALGHLLSPLTIDVGAVDVVHASANGLPAMVGMAAVARRGTPFLMSEHGLYLRERYLAADSELARPVLRAVLLRFYRLMCASSFRRADLVTPASDFNRRWALALGAEPDRVQTLHNGVDVSSFTERTAEVTQPHIIWLGRIDPIKDIHTLIRAAELVHRSVPEVNFRLFGDEPANSRGYLSSCRDLTHHLRLDDVVRFEGRVDEPANAFHAGQFSVLTSISEGFPYTVLESMSCGVPVVGTAVGGVPEAIGDTGGVVPPGDPQALADACVWMLRSDDQRRRFGAAARQRVEELFTLRRMVDGHEAVYRQLMEGEEVIDLRDRAPVIEWPDVPVPSLAVGG